MRRGSISSDLQMCVHSILLINLVANLMIVPGIMVYSSFLIRVCMFIVLKDLLISSATVIVRAGGAIWLNPFAMVLFSGCSAVTVECCALRKEEGCSPVSLQLLRGGIWAWMRCPCLCLCWGLGYMSGIMLVLRAVFNMLVRNTSPICVLGA